MDSSSREANGSFNISKDLEIKASYIKANDNKRAFVTVKNNSDDTIIDFSIVYLGFDRNGNVAKLVNTFDEIYGEEKYTLVNIIPGAVFGLPEENGTETNSIYLSNESNVHYIKTAISFIKFKSGKTWEIGSKDAWSENAIADFSLEAEKDSKTALKADAEAALKNPYIELSGIQSKHSTNQFINANDLFFDVKNTGDKTIKSFSIIVLEYDSEGNGIYLTGAGYLWNWRYVTINSHQITCDGLNVQQKANFVCSSHIITNCSNQLVIVDQIVFEDDTVWNNDCALQFMMYNESENHMQ